MHYLIHPIDGRLYELNSEQILIDDVPVKTSLQEIKNKNKSNLSTKCVMIMYQIFSFLKEVTH